MKFSEVVIIYTSFSEGRRNIPSNEHNDDVLGKMKAGILVKGIIL